MLKSKASPPTAQAPRGHHMLVANDLVVGEEERKAAVEAAVKAEREAAVRLIEAARSMPSEVEPPAANGHGTGWSEATRHVQKRQHRRASK